MTYNVIVNIPVVVTVRAMGENDARLKAIAKVVSFGPSVSFGLAKAADVTLVRDSQPRRTICGGCGEQPKACRNLPECQAEKAERRKR